MDVTGTTHPPAGATAILPVVQPEIRALGWGVLWIVALSSTLLVAVGCLGGNLLARYPVFWVWEGEGRWFEEGDGREGGESK